MTLLDIETFLAIVKNGNLTAAAKNLFISQPALTRRIQLMESELGYPLIKRQKGRRIVQLTDQGVEFYRIAWKWEQLLEETNSISIFSQKQRLSVASVNSVSRPLLSHIFPVFLKHEFRLHLFNAFSENAYECMAQGLYDLAFIEQQDFMSKIPPDIHTKPAFSESFVVATFENLPNENCYIDTHCLKSENEIYVPWNNEFKSWHAANFNEQIHPLVYLDDVSMLDCFFMEGNWVIVPYMTGECLRVKGANIYHLQNSPPDRVIYYLTRANEKKLLIDKFLSMVNIKLQSYEQVYSFLNNKA